MEPTEHDKRLGEIIAAHLRQYEVDRWFEHDPVARPTREEVHAAGYTVRKNDATDPTPRSEETAGVRRIARERLRQILEEGYTPDHDAKHNTNELSRAAEAYLVTAVLLLAGSPRLGITELGETYDIEWPWRKRDFKASDDPIRNLDKAGALIAAEIDRLLTGATDA